MLNTVTPTTEAEIVEAVLSAKRIQKSIHCFSGGFNWGYGTKPSSDSDFIRIDLTKMNKIISFDQDLGIVRIGPGVTQGQLFEFLQKNNYDFYTPTTGAGHRGSILGNALERGFGISPIFDHADSILSLRGILGDGSVYESGLNEVNSKLADCFSWGVGPQLDKMVTQSAWIIVTEVSIQLVKKHPCTDVIIVSFADSELRNIIKALRSIMLEDSGKIGSIKIFNRRQITNASDSMTNKILFKNNEWFMTMIVYSSPETRSPALKMIRRKLRIFTKETIRALNNSRIELLVGLLSFLPSRFFSERIKNLKDLQQMIKLADGHPSEVGYKALDIDFDYLVQKQFDFSNFDKNLIWFSPICPMDPEQVSRLIELVKRLNTHKEFRFNTYTWTVLNQRTLALVIPIVYEQKPLEDFWKWYKEIHLELKDKGFIPYRFHSAMDEFVRNELLPGYFHHVKKFEDAMDPGSLIFRQKKVFPEK